MGSPWAMGQLVPSLFLFLYVGLLQPPSQILATPELHVFCSAVRGRRAPTAVVWGTGLPPGIPTDLHMPNWDSWAGCAACTVKEMERSTPVLWDA